MQKYRFLADKKEIDEEEDETGEVHAVTCLLEKDEVLHDMNEEQSEMMDMMLRILLKKVIDFCASCIKRGTMKVVDDCVM